MLAIGYRERTASLPIADVQQLRTRRDIHSFFCALVPPSLCVFIFNTCIFNTLMTSLRSFFGLVDERISLQGDSKADEVDVKMCSILI